MEVLAFTPSQTHVAIKSLPKDKVLTNPVSMPAKTTDDLTISLIFPERNPEPKRNHLISAVTYLPENDAALIELRPRTYRKQGEVFEQWAIASIAVTGEVEFVIHRLPYDLVTDRRGASFLRAVSTLLSTDRDNFKERSEILDSLRGQRGSVYYINCTENFVPESVCKLVLPNNYYQVARHSDLLRLNSAARVSLVAQCADNSRRISKQAGQVATVGDLFDGAVPGVGYVSKFSLTWPGSEFGAAFARDGSAVVFSKRDAELDNHQFLSAVVLKVFGSEGLKSYLAEYNLARVDRHGFARAVEAAAAIRLTTASMPESVSSEMGFRARHLIPLLAGEVKGRRKIFGA